MASNSETGHYKNLAALSSLKEGIAAMGTTYAPSKAALKLTSITNLHGKCATAAKELKDATAPYFTAVKERENSYKPLSNMVGRVVGIFETSDTLASIGEKLRSLAYIIQGKNADGGSAANKKINADGSESEGHSSSQMSYDQRLKNLNDMLAILSEQGGYNPAEEPFKLSTLTSYAANLHAANQAVITTSKPYFQALAIRDNLFYTPETGMTDIGRDAKKYILKAFGPKSPEYATVKSVRFTTPRK